MLPAGLSDSPFAYVVTLFCPQCQELYYPRSSSQSRIDGAFFGSTFCHLFVMLHSGVVPSK